MWHLKTPQIVEYIHINITATMNHFATVKTTTSITKHHNNHHSTTVCLLLLQIFKSIFQTKSGDSVQTTLLTHCPNPNPNNPKKLRLVSPPSFGWRSSPCSLPTPTAATACRYPPSTSTSPACHLRHLASLFLRV